MKTQHANITDTNGRDLGDMTVEVYFDINGPRRPIEIIHAGRSYWRTGKEGTNKQTGEDVVELATESDHRIWSNLAASKIWED